MGAVQPIERGGEEHRRATVVDESKCGVGCMVQYFEDGPTYLWVKGLRLGAYATWEGAERDVVARGLLVRY